MSREIEVKHAGVGDADAVGTLVYRLLFELFPEKYAEVDVAVYQTAAKRLLSDKQIRALLAKTADGQDVGVLTLNECAAIYAKGTFGEICELYVDADYRSHQVGAALIDAACVIGEEAGWAHLEVGAPDVPRWQRTVDFYTGYGFYIVGPRLHLDLPV